MSWRPEGWKTPNVMALKDVKPGFVMADQVRFLDKSECEAFEAGADAILEALFKLAEESPTKTFVIDSQVIQIYRGEERTKIFIPDEEG